MGSAKLLLCVVCGLCVVRGPAAVAAAAAAASPAAMYVDSMAREKAIRVALADPDAPLKLEEVRAVVRAYEAIVAQYPASGYSDNALWQAGHLALDAFWRFGQAQDKDTCVRLLQRLVTSYPTSRLAKQVPAELRQTAAAVPRAAPATAPRPEPAPAATSSTAARVAPPRPPSGSIATIRDIRRSVLPDAVRVTIELDGEVAFHDDRIPDPSRVFLDLPGTRPAPALLDRTLRFESDADIVRQVRLGRHPNNTTRIVLDADGVTSYSVYPLYNPYRLVVDCVRSKALDVAAASLPAQRVAIWLRSAPAVAPQHGVIIAAARSSAASVAQVVAPPSLPLPSVPVPPAITSPPTAAVADLSRQSAEGATTGPPPRNMAGGL